MIFIFIYLTNLDMALQTKEQWTKLVISVNIAADIAEAYADKFILNRITELNFPDFTKDDLQELGDIKNMLCKQKSLASPTT